MTLSLRTGVSIGALVLLVVPIFAREKDNALRRLTPVPADQPVPIIDFFRPRLFQNPELNPSGTHFAAIVSTNDDLTDLIALELATGKIERLTGGHGRDINGYQWLNDNRLFFNVTQDKLYSYGLYAVELGHFTSSYPLQAYNAIVVIGFPGKHPLQAILWIRQSARYEGKDGGVVKIDTRRTFSTNTSSAFSSDQNGIHADIIETYPRPEGGDVSGYLADRNGELAFAITVKDGMSTLLRYTNKTWARCPLNLEDTTIVDVGDKPDELLALGPKVAGKPRALYRLNAATGEFGEKLFEDEKYDFVGVRLYRHPVDQHILGVQYSRRGPQSTWVDAGYARIQELMEAAFPGEVVRIVGSDRKENQFFISVSSDVQPPRYFLANLARKSFGQIANVSPWIDPKRMQPMQLMSYKARDGRDLEGYVTLPAGTSKERPAPLVVLPHGGPWVRDYWGFNPEVQFLASRGYAVFQPNYRGSTGYSWRFPEEDQWAFRKMHDDVTDGVKAVLTTGMIDRDRIAIMGGSFGGYLAISGAVNEKNLYRCAVTVAGVFDWEQVMKNAKNSDYFRSQYGILRRFLGDPKKSQEKFDEISPLRHIDQITIPIFVAHGTEDPVASVSQSKKLISELKKYSVPYEKLIEGNEGHGFHQLDHQVALYTAIEAFLVKNLAPRSAAAKP